MTQFERPRRIVRPCSPHALGRPHADYLRDGIHELRVRHSHVNYRILYFFCNDDIVLSHGFTKEREVPDAEIDRALRRRIDFTRNPEAHRVWWRTRAP